MATSKSDRTRPTVKAKKREIFIFNRAEVSGKLPPTQSRVTAWLEATVCCQGHPQAWSQAGAPLYPTSKAGSPFLKSKITQSLYTFTIKSH